MASRAKHRAKKKGLEYNIDAEYLESIDSDVCPYLQIPIHFNKGKGKSPDSKSLDRIDTNKGYTRGNVIICSDKANRMLSDGSLQELKTLVENFERVFITTQHHEP